MSSNEFLDAVDDPTVFIGETEQSFVLTFEPPLAAADLVEQLAKLVKEAQPDIAAERQHRRSDAEETSIPSVGFNKTRSAKTPQAVSDHIKARTMIEVLGMSVVTLDAKGNITTLGVSKRTLDISGVEKRADQITANTYKRVRLPAEMCSVPVRQQVSAQYSRGGSPAF